MQRRVLLGWFPVVLAGCAGVQGGQEGEEGARCTYTDVPLVDPDAVPDGFDRTPRELLRGGRFSGALAQHDLDVSLEIEPDFTNLVSRYEVDDTPDCGPHLETGATARLTFSDGSREGEQLTDTATLELRFGNALASVKFDVDDGDPLRPVMPAFSGEPVAPPILQIWLQDLDRARVPSRWRWSAHVACDRGSCSGGPSAGGSDATEGVDVEWGRPTLAPDSAQ